MKRKIIILTALLLLLSGSRAGAEEQEREWAATLYTAWLTEDALGELFVFNAELDPDFQFVALALSKRLKSINEHLDLEAEGQVVKHTKGQNHWEFNGLGVARWRTFPWDDVIDTSLALGAGLSFATETPEFEVENKGKSGKSMVYLMVELALAVPRLPNWELVARIHHRSAAYGLMEDDVKGASNAFGVGLKYRF